MLDDPGPRGAVPALCVVIPTRDRPAQLAATLAAIAPAVVGRAIEALVVDDGSQPPLSLATRFDGAVVLRQEARGPAAARNLAVRAARAPRVLLLGDDTPPARGTIERHLRAEVAAVAVQGRIDWHPGREVTPVMEFLAPAGPQFYFEGLRAGEAVPYTAVLGSNLSLPTEWLRREPFDERFAAAAFEDTELGLRLRRRGWRVLYDPEAVCWHDHRYATIEPFLDRQRRAGTAARLAVRVHPALLVRAVLVPTLLGLRSLLRARLARSARAAQHARWDWSCRVAFLRGFLGRLA